MKLILTLITTPIIFTTLMLLFTSWSPFIAYLPVYLMCTLFTSFFGGYIAIQTNKVNEVLDLYKDADAYSSYTVEAMDNDSAPKDFVA